MKRFERLQTLKACPALTIILMIGLVYGCGSSFEHDQATNLPYLELGSYVDGKGVTLGSQLAGFKVLTESKPPVIIAIGDCSHCMKLRAESLATRDRQGHPLIMLTSDVESYKRLRGMGKIVLLDRSKKLAKSLNATVFPRQYLLDNHGTVKVAETGMREVDHANGFEAL